MWQKPWKNDIKTHYQNLYVIEWQSKNFHSAERKAQSSVYTSLEYLLKTDNKEKNLRLDTLVNPFAQVFLHAVTRGKIVIPKYFLIRLGLHNMTGQKHVADIVSKLGHSISYYRTFEMETA